MTENEQLEMVGVINRLQAENKRLTTLADLGNMRAGDYRVMRDRALKAEAEIERLKKGWKADVIETANIKAEAYKEFAERLKNTLADMEYSAKTERKKVSVDELRAQIDWVLHQVVPQTIDNLLKEKVGEEK